MLRQKREQLGLTQAEVAEELAITSAQYCRLENGQRRLWFDQFVVLVRVLKLSNADVLSLVQSTGPAAEAA
jgi:transcriptional regulator with XRE-family HTH domain